MQTASDPLGDACMSVLHRVNDWLPLGRSRELTNCSIRQFLTLACALALVGYSTVPRADTGQALQPTEQLAVDSDPSELLRAALAKIDRRDGYEVRLLSALLICMASLTTR